MKFIIDMNLSPAWTAVLAGAGHEAGHWMSIGAPNAPDTEVLDHCRKNGAILLTHDLDFGAILAQGGSRTPSVVQVRGQEVDPGIIGEAVTSAVDQFEEQLLAGALVTIDLRRAKVRVLPIHQG